MNERQKRYNRKLSAAVADIGEIPDTVDPKRRAACEKDLNRFLTSYFPKTTGLNPLSDDHKRAIKRIERCVLKGGKYLNAFPRGFAKTTIGENSAVWALLYGHRKFVPLFGAGKDEAKNMIDSIKTELTENDLLYDDFPEVCHPIRMLEGKPQRCASQTHSLWADCETCGGSGKVSRTNDDKISGPPVEVDCYPCSGRGRISRDPQLTYIAWTSDEIVLPTIRIDDVNLSPASGAIVMTRGITAGARGMKHKRPDGTQQRPDFVIIDDPQTDESAASPSQVRKRMGVLRKSILKLGGHNKQIAVVMNATVIENDDMVDQLADQKKNPAWQSERIKMIRSWSKEKDLWERYSEIRNTYKAEDINDQQRAHREATAFYKKNRKTMDAGADPTWKYCFDPETELSAVQHAYNLLIDDGEEVFASECQNQPLIPEALAGQLTTDQVKLKAVGLARGQIPLAMSRLVCHIDVQKDSLWWSVYAATDEFSMHLVDDGVWPEQKRPCYRKADVAIKLGHKYPGTGTMGAITAGLRELTGRLDVRDFTREGDGAKLRIERGAVDSKWGDSAITVKRFLREKGGIWLAAEGQYIGPAHKPMAEYDKKNGETKGYHWIAKTTTDGRILKMDVNFYKSFVDQAIRTAVGDRVTMTLYGRPVDHVGTAAHFTSEHPTRVSVPGRGDMDIWKVGIDRNNEKFDNAVGACVLLSFIGCDPVKGQVAGVVKKARMKLSEMQARARRAS